MKVADARVARGGTAIAVTFEGDTTRLVRRIDLAPILGVVTADDPLFEAARPAEGGVEVDRRGGSELIPDEFLADAAARCRTEGRAELVIENAGALITARGAGGDPLGLVPSGAVVAGGGEVLWTGPASELGACGFDTRDALRIDAGGRLVTPGLVDCHAHPIFAGDRADEFARRARGEGYLEIAAAGGGIAATVGPTREASFEEHVRLVRARLSRALAAGTTTMEAKTGYDLTVDGELRMLAIARAADSLSPVELSPTLLGAHFVPPERKDDRAGYVRDVAERMVPAAAEGDLAAAVDVYCDEGAFTLNEARAVLEAGRRAGLAVRGHVGQFADLGAAQLVAELGGRSIDHVEQISEAGISAIAAAGVTAVMLPGACVQLRLPTPPVAALRDAGVRLAVASDLNPGTSYTETLPVQMWLATTHYGMTVEEAWLGVTREAARVLGRDDIGVLTPGSRCDAVIWNAEHPAEICYHYGVDLVHDVIAAGRPAL